MKNVVVIGGGNGSGIVLNALKKFTDLFRITSIVSVSDSGGSSGRLRKEFGILPTGDIMRAVLALSRYDYSELRKIFYEPRFSNLGKLDGHNLGNLFLALTTEYSGNFLQSIEALAQSVQAAGRVYPVTLKPADLVAELANGHIIRTDAFIDSPSYNRGLKIEKVWLEPESEIFVEAEKAIKTADFIIFSPGSLYTSVIAALLPKGVRESVEASRAKLIYAAGSAYRLDGETGPEELSGFVTQLERYLPRKIDTIIHNNHELSSTEREIYAEKKWAAFDYDPEHLPSREIISFDFESVEGGLSPQKLSERLKEILTR